MGEVEGIDGMKKNKTQQIAELSVENWNLKHPMGAAVKLLKDSGDVIETKTRSEAYIAASGHAVIFVDGVSGYYLLDRVTAK